jgi:hypothetical protein
MFTLLLCPANEARAACHADHPFVIRSINDRNNGSVLRVPRQNWNTTTNTPMKTFITLPVLLLSAMSLTAASPATPLPASVPSAIERELERQIDKYVTYPIIQSAKAMEGEVIVSFVIDAVGKVRVINATSKNDELCAYVLRMLSKVDIGDNPEGTWKTTHMRFRFHPEA